MPQHGSKPPREEPRTFRVTRELEDGTRVLIDERLTRSQAEYLAHSWEAAYGTRTRPRVEEE